MGVSWDDERDYAEEAWWRTELERERLAELDEQRRRRRRRWLAALAALAGVAWLGRRELRWLVVALALVAGWVLFAR